MKREILRVENMAVTLRGKVRLKDVSFSLFEGELAAFTGLNSAGKTVLANAVAGNIPFTAAHTFRNEQEMDTPAAYAESARDIFYISAAPELFDDMTVAQNLFAFEKHFSLALFPDRKTNKRAQALMKSLGLDISPTAKAGSLSTAKKHLVSICRAVALGAQILILDSISTQYSQTDFQTLSTVLRRLKHTCVMYVSHQPDPILMGADRIFLICGSTITGLLYRGGFQPEQLAAILESPRQNLRKAPYAGADCTVPFVRLSFPGFYLSLCQGEILLVQDQRDGARRGLIDAFFSLRPKSLWMDGRELGTYRQAVRAGLAVLPDPMPRSGLFDCLSLGENLTFQTLKKTSTFGRINPKIAKYALEKYKNILSSDACRSSAAWQAYALRLCGCRLANCRFYVLEDPSPNMDGLVLREFLSLLSEIAQEGAAILILANQYENYAPICRQVFDLESGQFFSLSAPSPVPTEPAADIPEAHC